MFIKKDEFKRDIGNQPKRGNGLEGEMVWKELLTLGLNKSLGHDEMHLQIVIESVNRASKPLALFLKKAINDGCKPQDWKRRTFYKYLKMKQEIMR